MENPSTKKNVVSELKKVTSDGVISEIKRAFAVVTLKEPEIKSVADSKASEMYGAGMFLLPIVVNILFMVLSVAFLPYGFFNLISNFLLSIVVISVGSFVATLFAITLIADKGFKTKIDVKVLFRVLSYASLVVWPTVLPYLFSMIKLYGVLNLLSITSYFVYWIFVVLFIYLTKF